LQLHLGNSALQGEERPAPKNFPQSLNRLVTIYVSQDIDRKSFLAKREELLSRKKAFQESIEQNEKGVSRTWLEPFTEWIQTARMLGEIARTGCPKEKKRVALKVFGSNLVLDCKKARGSCVKPWSLLVEKFLTGGMVPTTGLEPAPAHQAVGTVPPAPDD
jgi:hypothetical protein